MSDRDVSLPDQAFGDLLSEIDTRIRRLEARSTWPGATRSVVSATGAVYTVNTTVTVASFVVDPGRWVFFSMMAVDVNSSNQVGSIMTATSTGAPTQSRTTRAALVFLDQSEHWTLTSALEFSSPDPVTVTLQFFYTTSLGGSSGGYGRTALLAFPG